MAKRTLGWLLVGLDPARLATGHALRACGPIPAANRGPAGERGGSYRGHSDDAPTSPSRGRAGSEPIRARLYFRADQPRGEGIVVAHGVHYQGIDEGRLVPFARGLAESGLTVLTPELSDLADYRITDSGVGVIRDAVRYLAADREHVLGERGRFARVQLCRRPFGWSQRKRRTRRHACRS